MSNLRLKLATVCLAVWATWATWSLPALAVDLTKLDRTIAKEPAYKTAPKYCLLVFGADAKTRVWLVIDGDALYADRNGNGDLTEKGEQLITKSPPAFPEIGEIVEADSGARHTGLRIIAQKDGSITVSIKSEGKQLQRSGGVRFATRSKEAPIIHFNGPVSVQFTHAETTEAREVIKAVILGGVLGTPGLGEGTFASYKARDILQPNERVTVQAAFPHQDGKSGPILVKGFVQPDA